MSAQEKTGNEIIAEFAGMTVNELDYNESFDWLMPVCRKFCIRLSITEWANYDIKVQANLTRGRIEKSIWDYLYGRSGITEIFNELVSGIKWANQQKA